MTCRETIARLMDYVESQLAEQERRALEAHLDECPRCREFLESYRATPGIVKRVTSIEVPTRVIRLLHKALRASRKGLTIS